MIGRSFGALLVVWRDWEGVSPFRPYAPSWWCLCDCGRLALVPETALVRRRTEDCGCGVALTGDYTEDATIPACKSRNPSSSP